MKATQYSAFFISTATVCVIIVRDVGTVALVTSSITSLSPISVLLSISPAISGSILKGSLDPQPVRLVASMCSSHALMECTKKTWVEGMVS